MSTASGSNLSLVTFKLAILEVIICELTMFSVCTALSASLLLSTASGSNFILVTLKSVSSVVPTTCGIICALPIVPDKSPLIIEPETSGELENAIVPIPSVAITCPGVPSDSFNWIIPTTLATLVISLLARG